MSSLTDIRGIGPALAKALATHGITSPERLAKAEPLALMQVRGISPGRAQGFIDAAAALGAQGGAVTPVTKAPAKTVDPGAKPAETADKKKAKKKAEKKEPGKKKGSDKKAAAKQAEKTKSKTDGTAKKKSGKAAKDKPKTKKKSGKSKK
ncbi:helix-hairpin-helix domain-containing protein [uncultured Roseovarius sp.]|uniref:helix-hairpin-helix domain-containing protein n=1 Tax=uncultured Roseovarius sp. TaxID=293344 RepID=UPI0026133BBB|nr:helix-hairpin-helix domain-containing protein [uncultured Roseovarius sp.]